MTNLLLRWAASAVALLIVTYFVPGVSVAGIGSAFIAAAAFGLINATIGAVIKFFAWPFRILTLGLVTLIINALMLMLAAQVVSGFSVDGFWAALFGSILLSIVSGLLEMAIGDGEQRRSK